jgi:hypothetical protein
LRRILLRLQRLQRDWRRLVTEFLRLVPLFCEMTVCITCHLTPQDCIAIGAWEKWKFFIFEFNTKKTTFDVFYRAESIFATFESTGPKFTKLVQQTSLGANHFSDNKIIEFGLESIF